MKKKRFLSVLLASAVAAAVLAGCSGNTSAPADSSSKPVETSALEITSTAALEKTDFNVGYLNSTAHLLAFVAKEEGYFAEEGLNVTLTQFSNANEMASGLESGKLDVALIGSFAAVNLQSQGHPLSIFGGAMTNGHGFVIKSKYTEGLDQWDVSILKGRNVAVAKNNTDDLELQLLLKENNIEIGEAEDQVNIVYFDSQKDAYAALANDTIDACSVYSPYASLAKSQGYEIVYYDADIEAFQNLPCCRQVAESTQLAENPNSYTAFERAMIKAYKFYQENQEQTIQDVASYIDIDPELIQTEVYGGYSTSSPDPDKEATVKLKESAVDAGFTPDYDINAYYNTDIYETALQQILAENPDDAVYQGLQEHFETYA